MSNGGFEGKTTLRISQDDANYLEALTATVSYFHGVRVSKGDVMSRILDVFDGVLAGIKHDDREQFLTSITPLTLEQCKRSVGEITKRFYAGKADLIHELEEGRADDAYVFDPDKRL